MANLSEYMEYQGKPLVRNGDTLIYGDMNEKAILTLEIWGNDEEGNPNLVVASIVDSKDSTKLIKQKQYASLGEAFTGGVVMLNLELNK